MSTEHDIGYGWTLKQENEEELEVVYITHFQLLYMYSGTPL